MSTASFAHPKLGRIIARQIEDDIAVRGWPVGTVLASEDELLDRFDVSRAILREAIRVVEHTGLARMRRGPGGGLVVTEPHRDAVATAAGVYLASLGVSVGEMQDAWSPIAEACIRLAVERASADDLRSVVVRMDNMAAHRRLGAEDFVDLSQQVVALAGNPVLSLLGSAIGEVTASRLRGTRAKLDPPLSVDDALQHISGYRRLVEAIARHDEDAALATIRRINAAVRQRLHERPARPRSRPVTPDGGGKLAERVARLIRDDIERSGWNTGELLGTESELTERYHVSRAVLREAIRILEHHGAVATRRGPGGGLFVTQPDSSGVVHAARVILEFEGTTAAVMWEAREIVEEVCVRLATARVDADGQEILKQALAREAEATEWSDAEHVVHEAFAAVAQNRPLLLFVQALAELSTAHVRGVLRETPNPPLAYEDARRAHELISDAILSGNADLAAARMRRHVQAASKSY